VAQKMVRDVMTPSPRTIERHDTADNAARLMEREDVGVVVVVDGGKLCGILTDRDIVTRALAQGLTPSSTRVDEIYSADVMTLPPDASIEDAIQMMREGVVRRVPVVDGERPVGVVSLGDLALARDPSSALADISGAPANR
jgi:CBS domain-containing protein